MFLPLPAWLPTLSTASSQLSMRAQRSSHLVTIPWLWLNCLMNTVSAPSAVSINLLQLLVRTRSITATKCISKCAQSPTPSGSPDSLDYSQQACTIMTFKCIFPNSFDYILQVSAIIPSMGTSPYSLNYRLQLHLQTHSITASKWISNLAQSWSPSLSVRSPNQGL